MQDLYDGSGVQFFLREVFFGCDEDVLVEPLGEVQQEYNAYIKNLNEVNTLLWDDYYEKTVRYINQQIEYNNQLSRITDDQLALLYQELINAKEKFKSAILEIIISVLARDVPTSLLNV